MAVPAVTAPARRRASGRAACTATTLADSSGNGSTAPTRPTSPRPDPEGSGGPFPGCEEIWCLDIEHVPLRREMALLEAAASGASTPRLAPCSGQRTVRGSRAARTSPRVTLTSPASRLPGPLLRPPAVLPLLRRRARRGHRPDGRLVRRGRPLLQLGRVDPRPRLRLRRRRCADARLLRLHLPQPLIPVRRPRGDSFPTYASRYPGWTHRPARRRRLARRRRPIDSSSPRLRARVRERGDMDGRSMISWAVNARRSSLGTAFCDLVADLAMVGSSKRVTSLSDPPTWPCLRPSGGGAPSGPPLARTLPTSHGWNSRANWLTRRSGATPAFGPL